MRPCVCIGVVCLLVLTAVMASGITPPLHPPEQITLEPEYSSFDSLRISCQHNPLNPSVLYILERNVINSGMGWEELGSMMPDDMDPDRFYYPDWNDGISEITYRVKAKLDDAYSDPSDEISLNYAISNLVFCIYLENYLDGWINLEWENVDQFSGQFENCMLEKKVGDNSGWEIIGSLTPGGACSQMDPDRYCTEGFITDNDVYHAWRIRLKTAQGISQASEPVEFNKPASGYNLTAMVVPGASVALSWDRVSVQGMQYFVERKKVGTDQWVLRERIDDHDMGDRFSTTDWIDESGEYQYRVREIAPIWISSPSAVATVAVDIDMDSDGDGLSDRDELLYMTEMSDNDSDDDGMWDGWEVDNDLDPLVDDAVEDPDGDGVTNLEEYQRGLDPHFFNVVFGAVEISGSWQHLSWHMALLDMNERGELLLSGTNRAEIVQMRSGTVLPLSHTLSGGAINNNGYAVGFDPGTYYDRSSSYIFEDGQLIDVVSNYFASDITDMNIAVGLKTYEPGQSYPWCTKLYENGVLTTVEGVDALESISMNNDGVIVGYHYEGLKYSLVKIDGETVETLKDGLDGVYVGTALNEAGDIGYISAGNTNDYRAVKMTVIKDGQSYEHIEPVSSIYWTAFCDMLGSGRAVMTADSSGITAGAWLIDADKRFDLDALVVDGSVLGDIRETVANELDQIAIKTTDNGVTRLYRLTAVNQDQDNDGLMDYEEVTIGSSVDNPDTDGDGMPDGWEFDNGLLPLVDDALSNPDMDGYDNLAEFRIGTDPQNDDTDDDGVLDGLPVRESDPYVLYSVKSLGTLGGASSHASAINEAGHVVGWSEAGNGKVQAFIYRDDAMEPLQSLDGDKCYALDINEFDEAVGYALTSDGVEHPIVYDSNGMIQDLGLLPTWNSARAVALNDAGQVVGTAVENDTDSRAFLMNGNSLVNLHELVKTEFARNHTTAVDINNAGHIIGTRCTTYSQYSYLYDGAVHDLYSMTYMQSFIYALNAWDVCVGKIPWGMDRCLYVHDFIHGEQNFVFPFSTDGSHEGWEWMDLSSINNAQVAVGRVYAEDGVSHGFYLPEDNDGMMLDINDRLLPGDLAEGWVIHELTDINDYGFVVGVGSLNGGELQAVLLEPRPDTDRDGIADDDEDALGLDPQDADTDDDGMPDGWEINHSLSPKEDDAEDDMDTDGLSNLEEYIRNSDPNVFTEVYGVSELGTISATDVALLDMNESGQLLLSDAAQTRIMDLYSEQSQILSRQFIRGVLNNAGQCIGKRSTLDPTFYGTYYFEDGQLISEFDDFNVQDMNDSGIMVGYTSVNGWEDCFLYENGVYTEVELLLGDASINNRGVLFGRSRHYGLITIDGDEATVIEEQIGWYQKLTDNGYLSYMKSVNGSHNHLQCRIVKDDVKYLHTISFSSLSPLPKVFLTSQGRAVIAGSAAVSASDVRVLQEDNEQYLEDLIVTGDIVGELVDLTVNELGQVVIAAENNGAVTLYLLSAYNQDVDQDGVTDYEEVESGTNPWQFDIVDDDSDGYSDNSLSLGGIDMEENTRGVQKIVDPDKGMVAWITNPNTDAGEVLDDQGMDGSDCLRFAVESNEVPFHLYLQPLRVSAGDPLPEMGRYYRIRFDAKADADGANLHTYWYSNKLMYEENGVVTSEHFYAVAEDIALTSDWQTYSKVFYFTRPGFIGWNNVNPAQQYFQVYFKMMEEGEYYIDNVYVEEVFATDPEANDADGDTLPDWWEEKYGFRTDSPNNYWYDTDGDGLYTWEEYNLGTSPIDVDTDGDILPDGDEVDDYLTDPLAVDTDMDGLDDDVEVLGLDTDPLDVDTDHDGWEDSIDPDPKSRAWIDWGHSRWMDGMSMRNPYWPEWMICVQGSSYGYYSVTMDDTASFNVDADKPSYAGGLLIDIDRPTLGNQDLVLIQRLETQKAGTMFVQLRKANNSVVLNNALDAPYNDFQPQDLIYSDGLSAFDGYVDVRIPMTVDDFASRIILYRNNGALTHYSSCLFVDANRDGLDDSQVAAITAHPDMDYDGDGLADYWEYMNGLDFTSPDQDQNGVIDSQDDFDGDGVSNLEELAADSDPNDRPSFEAWQNPKTLAAGANFSVALRETGDLYAWGRYTLGELGDGRIGNADDEGSWQDLQYIQQTPVQITLPGNPDIVEVSARHMHALALDKQGRVYAWGSNKYGDLGIGSAEGIGTNKVHLPFMMTGLPLMKTVSAGYFHNLGISRDGHVWTWGSGWEGQLGVGFVGAGKVPVKLNSLQDIVAVDAGNRHCLALREDGTVWAWGDNAYGQLGNGTTQRSGGPVKVVGISNAVAIASANATCMALHPDGTVSVWGDNRSGQLGIYDATLDYSATPIRIPSDLLRNVIRIGAGYNNLIALTGSGNLFIWGIGGNGQLGDNLAGNSYRPVIVDALTKETGIIIGKGASHNLVAADDGHVYTWGVDHYRQTGHASSPSDPGYVHRTPVECVSDSGSDSFMWKRRAVNICSGLGVYLYLLEDNTIIQRENWNDETGKAVTLPVDTPVVDLAVDTSDQIGYALTADGVIYYWDMYNAVPDPQRLFGVPSCSAISGGSGRGAALCPDGSMYTWTTFYNGIIATQPQYIMGGVVKILAHDQGWMALDVSGSLFAWGNNDNGLLAQDPSLVDSADTPRFVEGLPSLRDVAVGTYHALAIDEDDQVWIWGLDPHDGTESDMGFSWHPSVYAHIPGVMEVGATFPVYSLALKNDGTVWVWGTVSTETPIVNDQPHQLIQAVDIIDIDVGYMAPMGLPLGLTGNGEVVEMWGFPEGAVSTFYP